MKKYPRVLRITHDKFHLVKYMDKQFITCLTYVIYLTLYFKSVEQISESVQLGLSCFKRHP